MIEIKCPDCKKVLAIQIKEFPTNVPSFEETGNKKKYFELTENANWTGTMGWFVKLKCVCGGNPTKLIGNQKNA